MLLDKLMMKPWNLSDKLGKESVGFNQQKLTAFDHSGSAFVSFVCSEVSWQISFRLDTTPEVKINETIRKYMHSL